MFASNFVLPDGRKITAICNNTDEIVEADVYGKKTKLEADEYAVIEHF